MPLARDYQAMRETYVAEPPSIDELPSTAADLEERINRDNPRG